MRRMTSVHTSRTRLLFFLSSLLVFALILGGLGIPLVSSEGMVIRAHLIEGDLPVTPEDAAWAKVAPP